MPLPAKRCKTLAFFHGRTDSYLGTIRPAGWMMVRVKIGPRKQNPSKKKKQRSGQCLETARTDRQTL